MQEKDKYLDIKPLYISKTRGETEKIEYIKGSYEEFVRKNR